MVNEKPHHPGVTGVDGGGSQDNVTSNSARTTVTFGEAIPIGPVYIPKGTSATWDNVNYTPPSQVLSIKPGAAARVDVDGLQRAIEELRRWADYLGRLEKEGMQDIKQLMDGPETGSRVMRNAGVEEEGSGGALGGSRGAGELAQRHSVVWQSYQDGLNTVAANLFDAADALSTIQQRYGDVERANASSAAEMEASFTDAKSVPQNP